VDAGEGCDSRNILLRAADLFSAPLLGCQRLVLCLGALFFRLEGLESELHDGLWLGRSQQCVWMQKKGQERLVQENSPGN
jgi:hypothetical protein